MYGSLCKYAKVWLYVLTCLGSVTFLKSSYGNGVVAIDQSSPDKFIAQLFDRGLKILNNQSQAKTKKEQDLQALLKAYFDLTEAARFALGARFQGISPTLKSEYFRLFETMVFRIYSEQVEQLSLKSFRVIRTIPLDAETTKVVTVVERTENPEPIRVEWTVVYKDGKFSVTEATIETVAVILSVAQQISGFLRKGKTVEEVLDELRLRYGKEATLP